MALGLANTALPPDFTFGLPVLWLAPLVLAFGTLRYDAGRQLYVLALLLSGIVAAALASGPLLGGSAVPPPPQLAPFFALPPNIMRRLMLLLAGLVLAVATRRTRVLLERAIAETRWRLNLTRYLPPQIADMLAGGDLDALRRGWRQRVAVLFVDIRGFVGEVFVGAVGDEQRLEHTVPGDVVNTAQRLQELTREKGCALMVSAELIAAAGAQPDGTWSAPPERILRGRRQAVRPFARRTVTEP